jgi:hypothetical protein
MLAIPIALVILLLIAAGFVVVSLWRGIRRSVKGWETITHVPRWVQNQADIIRNERNRISSSTDQIFNLNGTRFNYRLTFRKDDWELLIIERKRKKYNKKLNLWE